MRITSGNYKSRLIRVPRGIRPTQEKVRKALFDILGDVSGLSFLEFFAGSGAVGFEAVSRGAAELVLAEEDPQCLRVIKRNIESLGLACCALYRGKAGEVIEDLAGSGKKFDIIFLDPPYYKGTAPRRYPPVNFSGVSGLKRDPGEPLTKKTLQMLDAYDILAPNGIVAVQHFRKDILPHDLKNLALARQKHYGDTTLSFFKRRS